MKSNFKHTHLFLSAFFIFCFASCWAQKSSTDKIEINGEYTKLKFPNKEILLDRNRGAYVSPDKKLAVVVQHLADTSNEVKLTYYDQSGNSIKSFSIKLKLGIEQISNDGRFVAYGNGYTVPGADMKIASSVLFYDENGQLIKDKPKESFSVGRKKGVFTDSGLFILFASLDTTYTCEDSCRGGLFIYDKKYNLKDTYIFKNYGSRPFERPIIDETKQEIYIQTFAEKNVVPRKISYVFNFKGELIRKEGTWKIDHE